MPHETTTSTTATKKKSEGENVDSKISIEKPTPLNFHAFVPWLCLEWQVPDLVVVKRVYQEKSKKNDRKLSSKSGKTMKTKELEDQASETKTLLTGTGAAPTASSTKKVSSEISTLRGDYIVLKAIYDPRGYLVEVSIKNSPFKIHRKVIQAINICVPFHAYLSKLVINGKGLSFVTLCDISKLLPHSNITHVCLDDTRVPQGNYFVLLDHTSQLKCLFLNRCHISDVVCKEIAVRIHLDSPAHSSLRVLELSSNSITDVGAEWFGDMLKMNRRLLHLNLTGNKITDVGAKAILKHLMEFEVSQREIIHSTSRQLAYIEKRKMVLEKCMDDVINKNSEGIASKMSFKMSKSTKFKGINSIANVMDEHSVIELAETMTKELMGDFEDPFESKNIVRKDNKYFAKGNTTLCSLNLSYNNLGYPSVKSIAQVLQYQSRMLKSERGTGLLRIVIDGNLLPDCCAEYKTIEMCLNKLVRENLPMDRIKRRSPSYTKKKAMI